MGGVAARPTKKFIEGARSSSFSSIASEHELSGTEALALASLGGGDPREAPEATAGARLRRETQLASWSLCMGSLG